MWYSSTSSNHCDVNSCKTIVELDDCIAWLYGMFDGKSMMGAVEMMRWSWRFDIYRLRSELEYLRESNRCVKCWDSNSMGDEGGRQGRIGVNSNGFLRCRTKGASTPDLIVTEFQTVCGQMDLASACVLRPLNCLVLYFKMRGVTGWTSGGPGYTRPELAEEVTARRGVEWMILNSK